MLDKLFQMILVSTVHSDNIKFGKGKIICPESPTSIWKRLDAGSVL